MSASSPRVYVLLDPVQDYEESMRLLSVNGTLQAAQAAARRARNTVHPRFSFENLVTPSRTLHIELRSGDLILGRWVQQGVGFGNQKIGSWTADAKPTEADPETAE